MEDTHLLGGASHPRIALLSPTTFVFCPQFLREHPLTEILPSAPANYDHILDFMLVNLTALVNYIYTITLCILQIKNYIF